MILKHIKYGYKFNLISVKINLIKNIVIITNVFFQI